MTGIQTAITMYTLVMASLMITGGKVGEILGRKRAFTIGCVVYACGSLTTALAPNLTVLMIGWSGLEGLGAVLIMPAIVALVASNFGKPERPRAYGLVAAAGAIAAALGPLIGGAFTTYASWRWVFAGEVLIVAVILLLARRVNDTPAEEGVKLDLFGTFLSALGLGLIVFGILKSGTWGVVQAKPEAPQWIGLSPVIWLLLGGGVAPGAVPALGGPAHRARGGRAAQPQAAAQRSDALRGALVPVHVPRAGGDVLRRAAVPVGGARAVGDRDRRAAAADVAHAAAVRRRGPEALAGRQPAARRQRRLPAACSRAWCCWSACSTSAPGRRSSPARCCSSGPGSGAMASQLGSVTVSAVPDEQSGEVGGLQNTGTQLGASIGTALAGAILISALTASFFTGIQNNPAIPDNLAVNAQAQLATGVPFVSDKDLQKALDEADVPPETANAVVDENEQARIEGLRSALALLALVSLLALLFTRGIPTVQPGAEAKPNAPPIDN